MNTCTNLVPAIEPRVLPGHAAASTAPDLTVRCFGRFEVSSRGYVVKDWRRDKAKTLLKLLVAHNGSMQRDMLLDLLWSNLEPEAAMRNLRVTLHALRRALEHNSARDALPYVLTRGDAVELNPNVSVWIDVMHFRALYELATSLWRRGQTAESVRAYEEVERLYGDDYLVEDLYEEWTVVPREQFKDQYLLVVTRLADVALERGEYDACVEYCYKILARDMFREDAYERLMRCHVNMGRPARALRWYDLCREMLRRELNIEPSEPITRLAQSINHNGQEDHFDRSTLADLLNARRLVPRQAVLV